MELQTIVTIVLVIGALLAVGFVVLAENGIESLVNWLFRKGGLSSGLGPVAASARNNGGDVVVSFTNQGKDKIMLVAIEVRDASSNRHFPIPHRIGEISLDPADEKSARQQLSKITIPANATTQVFFHLEALRQLQIKTLAAMDNNGKTWPADLSGVNWE